VDGDERVQTRPPPAPDEQLLVLEGLEVRVGQLPVIVSIATAPPCRRPRRASRTGLTPPVEPVAAAGMTMVSWVEAPVPGLVVPAVLEPLLEVVPVDPGVPVVPDAPVVEPLMGVVDVDPVVPVGVVEAGVPLVPVAPVVDPAAGAPVVGVVAAPVADELAVDGDEPLAGTLT
jgi:hypothetical protein